jgi:sugar transferase (PEP-CTERM/EpsH1 system associated)
MRILTLISRVPWPLTDGAAIRDFNLMREAARRHEMFLLCFLCTPSDRDHLAKLRPYCKDIVGIDLRRPRATMLPRAAKSLIRNRPFITEEYRRGVMATALQRMVAERQIDVIHAHFLHMSQYYPFKGQAAFVHDAHNLEHVLWKRIAGTARNPLTRLFAASQCSKLIHLQRQVGLGSEKCVTLSEDDRTEYERICPRARVATVPNGADVEYWQPSANSGEPRSMLYFGNLGWPPQSDAVLYFHRAILPAIWERIPDAKLYIVGQNPPESVRRLADGRVIVKGFVPDMREYVARASVVVMPLRIGAGTKHRVLQALAMQRPVVCTRVAAEGIDLIHGRTALIADQPAEFAAHTIRLLEDRELRAKLGKHGRELVLSRYDWRSIYDRLEEAFEDAHARRSAMRDRLSSDWSGRT